MSCFSIACHDIAIGQRTAGIGVRELIAVDQRVQGIALDIQVVLRMPLPDRGVARIDLAHLVPIQHPLVLGARLSALHARSGLRTQWLPAEVESLAGLATAESMELVVIRYSHRTLPGQSYSRRSPPLPASSGQPSAGRPTGECRRVLGCPRFRAGSYPVCYHPQGG